MVTKTKGSASDAIRQLLGTDRWRNAPAAEISRVLGKRGVKASPGLVHSIRYRLNRGKGNGESAATPTEAAPSVSEASGRPRKASGSPESVLIDLRVPRVGAILRLSNGKGLLGTLAISPDGVAFVKVKAKKAPTKYLTWEKLGVLFDSGLLD